MGDMSECICYGICVRCTHVRAFTHMRFGKRPTILPFRLNIGVTGQLILFINHPESTGSSTFRYLP